MNGRVIFEEVPEKSCHWLKAALTEANMKCIQEADLVNGVARYGLHPLYARGKVIDLY